MPDWIRFALGGAGNQLVGMGLGRFSYTLMITPLIESGQLSADQAGYVGAFNLFGFFIGIPLAPYLVRAMKEVPALRLCLIVSLVCLIASIPPWGFAWLAFWRFLVGVTMAVMMIYSLTVVTRHAPSDRLGAATGIVFTGVGIGVFISSMMVPSLLDHGLAAAWTGLALLGGAGTILGLWGWAGAPSNAAAPQATAAEEISHFSWPVMRLYAAYSCFSLGLVVPTIYWVDHAVRGMGHDKEFGGLLWALFGLGAVLATFLWGWLGDRLGLQRAVSLVLFVLALGIAAPVLLPAVWMLVLASLVVGTQPGFSAVVTARTRQVVGSDQMPKFWGGMTLVYGIAQTIGGFGYVKLFSVTGDYLPVFLVGAAAMAVGGLVSFSLKRNP